MNPEGRLLHDRYRVLSQIGSGGQASVWLAEDTLLERRVALKELVAHAENIDLDESRARALIEARALARVRHRCIVRVHDIFFVGPDPWIVMEYICGESLADIVAADPLTERRIAAIGLSVLDGLQAVHAARIVHRDVKPLNILVDHDGAIFLVDFGIAKIAEDAAAADHQRDGSITGRGRVIGTPEYLAPEQIHGHPATPASDLWSLGVTLYYAMEGHTPFARASGQPAPDLRSAILYEDPPQPASRGPLAMLVLWLLAKDPAKRPSLVEASQMLESILAGQSQYGQLPGTDGRTASAFPAPGRTFAYTDAMAFTETARPLDDAERARNGIADAMRGVNSSGTDSGVARLLAKPNDEAAHILNNCSPEVAAELMAGMAASRASKAGNILQMLSVTRSGKVLDYMPSAASAEVVVVLPERRQQVRVLSQADVRTVAEVLMEMPGEFAERLVASLPLPRAGAVLNEVKPATAAKILRVQSPDLRARLLQALSPEFRTIVRRYL